MRAWSTRRRRSARQRASSSSPARARPCSTDGVGRPPAQRAPAASARERVGIGERQQRPLVEEPEVADLVTDVQPGAGVGASRSAPVDDRDRGRRARRSGRRTARPRRNLADAQLGGWPARPSSWRAVVLRRRRPSWPGPSWPAPSRAVAAFLAGAFLAGAFLAGAFLAGAFLAGAFLAAAFLAGAFLATAFFAGAFFAGAFFAGAFLAGAFFAGGLLGRRLLGGRGLLRRRLLRRRPSWPDAFFTAAMVTSSSSG